MNPDRLQTLIKTIYQASTDLQAELEEGCEQRDPISVHIFQARRLYHHSRDRSDRQRDEDLRRSYLTAQELGYRGTPREWMNLIVAFTPAPDPYASRPL